MAERELSRFQGADLHLHDETGLQDNDGRGSFEEYVRRAYYYGFVIGRSPHCTTRGNEAAGRVAAYYNVPFVAGVEAQTNEGRHVMIVGLPTNFEHFEYADMFRGKPFYDYVQIADQYGAAIILPHPIKARRPNLFSGKPSRPHCFSHEEVASMPPGHAHAVEVYFSTSANSSNGILDAAEEANLAPVAGSDAHQPWAYGRVFFTLPRAIGPGEGNTAVPHYLRSFRNLHPVQQAEFQPYVNGAFLGERGQLPDQRLPSPMPKQKKH